MEKKQKEECTCTTPKGMILDVFKQRVDKDDKSERRGGRYIEQECTECERTVYLIIF